MRSIFLENFILSSEDIFSMPRDTKLSSEDRFKFSRKMATAHDDNFGTAGDKKKKSVSPNGKTDSCNLLWYLQESNRGHTDFQSDALPTELRHQL